MIFVKDSLQGNETHTYAFKDSTRFSLQLQVMAKNVYARTPVWDTEDYLYNPAHLCDCWPSHKFQLTSYLNWNPSIQFGAHLLTEIFFSWNWWSARVLTQTWSVLDGRGSDGQAQTCKQFPLFLWWLLRCPRQQKPETINGCPWTASEWFLVESDRPKSWDDSVCKMRSHHGDVCLNVGPWCKKQEHSIGTRKGNQFCMHTRPGILDITKIHYEENKPEIATQNAQNSQKNVITDSIWSHLR